MLRLSRLACLLGVLACAGPAFSQNIANVSPQQAAVGTELTIVGSGFGVAKPKVQLFDSVNNKKYALKVVSNSDTEIHATISKAVLGNLTLQVIVKGAPAPAEAANAVTIMAPHIDVVSAASAEPNAPLTLTGDFFGIKKGKIRVNGQSAKVVTWTMNQIELLMPKKLPNGFWKIAVDNKLAINEDESIEVVNSPLKLGKASLNLAIEGTPLKFKFTPGVPVAGHLVMVGVSASNPSKNIQLIIPFDAATENAPKPVTTGAALLLNYVETGKISGFQLPPVATWTASGLGIGTPSVFITGKSGGQVSGTVDSHLTLQFSTFSTAKPLSVHLTGSFIIDV